MSAALRRRLSWAAVVAGLALAVALAVWLGAEQRAEGTDRGNGGPRAAGADGTDLAEASSKPPPRPRLEIPAIGVSAHSVELGLNRDGSLEVPKRHHEVGWWKRGPEPGERGPAVIAGHADSRTGPAVFHRLDRLRRGDRVRWQGRNGITERFVVTRIEEHPKADFPTEEVYGRTRRAELRLITCSGPPDSSGRRSLNNLIVFARRT